ncbi:MAG TPA: 4-oxalocrotonate tautomerase family protein [Nitrososphaerales archaeon]|nr:4-oxalocrotonate tautomerase family protein [Nitrososphaerales archaeon]
MYKSSISDTNTMPLVTISLWPGRTPEKKEELAKAITDTIVKVLGSKREHVIVVYQDTPKENWYVAGNLLT